MIKKSFRNAAIGTLAAGALALPAAGTIAPQLSLMECNPDAYPGGVSTFTSVVVNPPAIKPREGTEVRVQVQSDESDPVGIVKLNVTGPKGKRIRSKSKPVDELGTAIFRIGGFRLGKRQEGKTVRINGNFKGDCQFKNSRGVAYLTIYR